MLLIDSNILIDIWQDDPHWSARSMATLHQHAALHELAINLIVLAEISVRFASRTEVENALASLGISLLNIPSEAAFLAGKAFASYRKQGGTRTSLLPDFFIGAHAAVLGATLLTRDTRRYSTYFPTVPLITP
jgi:predicted nucleic acid-binding protein